MGNYPKFSRKPTIGCTPIFHWNHDNYDGRVRGPSVSFFFNLCIFRRVTTQPSKITQGLRHWSHRLPVSHECHRWISGRPSGNGNLRGQKPYTPNATFKPPRKRRPAIKGEKVTTIIPNKNKDLKKRPFLFGEKGVALGAHLNFHDHRELFRITNESLDGKDTILMDRNSMK